MPNFQNLEELEEYLRRVLPQWKSVQNLQRNSKFGFIDFKWYGHHFAVKPSLEAFELKDNRLYVTAGSLLLQTTLATRTGHEQRIGTVVDTLDKATDLLQSHQGQGLALLGSIKATLHRMLPDKKI